MQPVDRTYRPKSLAEFHGQSQICENLTVYINAAKTRGEPLEHLLFCGPAGLGKTTLAGVVAGEMGRKMIVVNAPSVRTKADMLAAIAKLTPGDILFVDEIHRLKLEIQELLYPVMEDFRLEVVVGDAVVQMDVPPFTLIGATTHVGLLSRPMRERFGDVLTLVPYSVDELAEVVQRAAPEMGLWIRIHACYEIAKRSRSTPRVALKILRRVRDYAQAAQVSHVDADFVQVVSTKLGIDEFGLDQNCRKMLEFLSTKKRPVGLQAIASNLGEAKETIEDSIEPFLLMLGFVERMPAGRVVTKAGLDYVAQAA